MNRRPGDTRIRLSILDRLTESPPSPNLDRLKRSLLRNLDAILNSKRDDRPFDQEYSTLSDSLLAFGLPDFTSFGLRNASDQDRLRRSIEATIRRFEPRMMSVNVTMDPRAEGESLLRFHIEGLLKVEPFPEPINFDTVLETDSCRFVVGG